MKKKEKQMIGILILVAVVIVVITYFVTRGGSKEEQPVVSQGSSQNSELVQIQEDGSKVNTSEKVNETREIEGIKIDNIKVTEQNGQTTLLADVTNTTETAKKGFVVDIVMYDKAGKEIGKIPGKIGDMQVGETIQIQAGITEDYVEAYDFKIEKKK